MPRVGHAPCIGTSTELVGPSGASVSLPLGPRNWGSEELVSGVQTPALYGLMVIQYDLSGIFMINVWGYHITDN